MTRFTLQLSSEGNTAILNLNSELTKHLREIKGEGLLHLFAVGSTVALTTIEFEPGLVNFDVKAMLQKLVPDDARYEHEATWHDDNGHSHLRAMLIGPDLMVPFKNGELLTGEYQQVAPIDLDTQPRKRTAIKTILQ